MARPFLKLAFIQLLNKFMIDNSSTGPSCMLFDILLQKTMNLTEKLPAPSLTFCIVMDLIGYASFSIPLLAEVSDLIWAPLSAYIFLKSFGGKIGRLGSVFNFIEEILPFTDFIPSFSIA